MNKKNNKKEGYVLLEAVVILMIVACICVMLNKVAINNHSKLEVIYTREDIKTLTLVEEKELLNATEFFNNNLVAMEYVKENPHKDIRRIRIYRNSWILVKERKSDQYKSYIELKCEESYTNGVKRINLVPKFYRTEYM